MTALAPSTAITPWTPNPRQRALIQKMGHFPYPKMAEAARDLSISENTARQWNTNPHFRRALAACYEADQRDVREDMEHKLLALVPRAISVKLRALQGEDLALAAREASWVLDRVSAPTPADDPSVLREEIEIFRTVVLTAIEKAAPDVRRSIEESLRRHEPLLNHPDAGSA